MAKKLKGQMFMTEVASRLPGMPPVHSVRNECLRLGLTVQDCDQIYDFWLGNGFKTGKNKVRNWQAVIRTWRTNKWFNSQRNSKSQSDQDKARMSAEMAELRKIHSSDANRRLL